MALREVLARFGISVDGTAALQAVNRNANSASDALGKLQKVVGGAVAALGVLRLARVVTDTANAADAAVDTADALGVAAKDWQALQAFGATAGGTDMATGLRTLAKAADNNDKAFAKLGISARDAQGRLKPMAALAEESLVALSDLGDETQRVALAATLFGRSGNTLLPSLKGGSAAMREQLARAKELGVAFDDDLGASAGEFNDTMYYVNAQMMRLRGNMLKFVLPAMRWASDTFLAAQTSLNRWTSGAKGSGEALRILGTIGGIAVAAVAAAKWQAIAQGIATVNRSLGLLSKKFLLFVAVFLVIEDLITFLQGGDSVIGSILKEFGLIDDANESGKRFAATLKSWLPAIQEVGASIKRFYAETLIGFGALVGMWTSGNEAMRAEYESVFMRNTATIEKFGDAFTGVMLFLPRLVRQALAWLLEAFVSTFDGAIDNARRTLDVIAGVFLDVLGTGVNTLALLASVFDAVFGTQIKGAVFGAGEAIKSAIEAGVDGAIAALERLTGAAERVVRGVVAALKDPIGAAANLASGQGLDGQASAREAAAYAAQRNADRLAGNVTIAPETVINVTAPAGDGPGVARATAGALEATQNRIMSRALAAVDR